MVLTTQYLIIMGKTLKLHKAAMHLKKKKKVEQNIWMNEWCIYIALFVCWCPPIALYNHVGGVSPKPPPVCSIHLDDATAATGQRRQCAHHTPATGGEERESLSQSSGWGLLGGHDWQGPVGGIWSGHRGYTPTLYEKCHGIFNDHRESGPRFNVSSERRLLYNCI